ncbi:aquaporin [Rickenella mellea]|uniref:Aquaporin n=1 Tax=Rickenella mellea TaxID=50990 RepID=A0A4Y7Q7L9_9AGAM|nr:aquaporin [Rickenella mellea]
MSNGLTGQISTRSSHSKGHVEEFEHSDGSTRVVEETCDPASLAHCGYDGELLETTPRPNRWCEVRQYIREPAAEFLGTMILVICGAAVDCQVVLSSNPKVASSPKGDYLSVSLGWALGAALGVLVSGGISGGHINPAVTLCLAMFRGFPWKKVPAYMFAQLLGAFCGAGVIYANYFHAIDQFEGLGVRTVPGTAGLFSTYALPYMTDVSCFFDEFLGTALLLIVVMAMTDKKNTTLPAGLVFIGVFFCILVIGLAIGVQTGFAINPARDLGPRLFTAIVYGREVFTFRHQYWLWCPVIAPFIGGIVGSFLYDSVFFTGEESIINAPNAFARKFNIRAGKSAREKVPAETDMV